MVRIRSLLLLLTALLCGASVASAQPFDLTVEAPPSLHDMAERIRTIDPRSLSLSLSRAGLELPRKVTVYLEQDDDQRARGVPGWVVARAFGTDTIVIYPRRIRSYPYESLESVVLHEMVHLSLTSRAGGRPLPRWFHEGVAVSVESGWGIGSQARLLLAAARDPGIADVTTLFASESEPDTSTAYLLSAALIEDVRRRFGLASPGAIAARVAHGESFDIAFHAETGETPDEAAAHAWRVYRGLRWVPIVTNSTGVWSWILLLAIVAFIVQMRRRRQKRWDEDDEGNLPEPADGWDDGPGSPRVH